MTEVRRYRCEAASWTVLNSREDAVSSQRGCVVVLASDYDALAARLATVERENAAIKDTVGDTEFSLRQQLAEAQGTIARLEELLDRIDHRWSRDAINSLESENAGLQTRLTASEAALGDCLMLARRRQRTDQVNEDWSHIIRFCDQAGVKPDGVLRQNQSSEAKRQWTRERPTEPGWYWWRDKTVVGYGKGEVCRVSYRIIGVLSVTFLTGYVCAVDSIKGQWARVEMPEDGNE